MPVIFQFLFWVVVSDERGWLVVLAVGWGRCFCASAVGTMSEQTRQSKRAQTLTFMGFSFGRGGYKAAGNSFKIQGGDVTTTVPIGYSMDRSRAVGRCTVKGRGMWR